MGLPQLPRGSAVPFGQSLPGSSCRWRGHDLSAPNLNEFLTTLA